MSASPKPNQSLLLPFLLRSIRTKSAAGAGSPASASPIIDLTDTERLFGAAATGDLVRSLAMMYAMAVEPAVDLGMAALKSPAVMRSPAVMAAVRGTVYRQFCAGEGMEEAAETLRRLWGEGLRGILDYGLEDAVDGEACDRNLAGFLRTVDLTAKLPANSVSFACVKITAICPVNLLEHISDLLRWQKKHPSFSLPWKLPSLPVLANSSPLYHTPSIPPPLTADEESELHRSHARLSTLCSRCAAADLPLLVDAEYTSVQPAIDHIVYSAALQFNAGLKKKRPIVYNTMQSYLRDAKERLVQAVVAAESAGISIGFKLVRGAYLSRESKLASAIGAASPIHQTIQETHDCYNDCVGFMLERTVNGSAACLLATHNLESGKAAAAKAEEVGIGKGDERLQFAQLMGMADGLSLGLRNAGFQVSKYLPFGPVEQVIPYLLRRAEENRGFLSTSTLDRDLIRKELKRRLRAAVQRKYS